MSFQLRSFLHHLADEIERDAGAVIGLLRDVGVKVPDAVGREVEVGAGLVGNLTDDGTHVLVTPPAPSAPAAEPAPNVTQAEGDPFAVHR
jgi:hypothetical protein